tara:strand:- start:162 stop:380 length:219 start_codon:yes stop_codon:yes gene_type:complete
MEWSGGDDDKSCIIGDYTLRAEQMDKDRFWWNVSFKGVEVYSDALTEKFAKTMSKAQYYCVYHKIMHEKTNK